MNDVQAFIDRQLGIYCRFQYDNIFKRLVVDEYDSLHGVQASNIAPDFNPDPPIFACRFAEKKSYEHFLALANEDGRVAIQDTSKRIQNYTVPLEGFQCHNNAVFDLAWMPQHLKFVTVSGDHSACIWDLADGTPTRVQIFAHHTRSVKTAVFRPTEPSVFATGARDGHVLVWDSRSNAIGANLVTKPDNCLLNCHSSFTPKTPASGSKRHQRLADNIRATSITGLAFQNEYTLISCGECDGNIKVWDLRKNYSVYKKDPLPKHAIPYCGSSTKNGYTNLIMDDAKIHLYASCMDNVIYCFNISTYSLLPEQRYVGHENGTFYIKTSLSPDCQYLVSGSSDKNAYIWNVKYSQPLVRLEGHTAEVTCAAWCQTGDTSIVTCSDDARHMIWKIGKEFKDKDELNQLRGRAEAVPKTEVLPFSQWGSLDKTPKSLKRRYQTPVSTTPTSYSAKRLCIKDRNTPDRNVKKTKRCLTDMLNASKSDNTEADIITKKMKVDSTAFYEVENVDPRLLPSCSKRRSSEREYSSPTKRRCELTPPKDKWNKLTPSKRKSDDLNNTWYSPPNIISSSVGFMSPTKYFKCNSPKILSPKQLPNASNVCNSPITDLPNFVLNGDAPHLRLMSPVKKRQETINWLTVIAKEKKVKCSNEDSVQEVLISPKVEQITGRRNSATERTTKQVMQKDSLLKYFNVLSKKT